MNEYINHFLTKYDLTSLEITSNPRELIIMLITEIKNCSIADVKLNNVHLDNNDIAKLDQMLNKIVNENIPPQYLTNKAYIYGIEFYVDENVLIPRQDTETLIESMINIINDKRYTTLLDMCTGSGVIGISAAIHSNISKVTLADVSENALQVANKNIELLDESKKCITIETNMFQKLYDLNSKYDIIVSNPPYLTKTEMAQISPFVKKEPSSALYGGKNGLDFYNIIFSEAKNFLNDGGVIMVEIGYHQAKDVIDIICSHSEYKDIKVIQDINSKDRVIICHFQK